METFQKIAGGISEASGFHYSLMRICDFASHANGSQKYQRALGFAVNVHGDVQSRGTL